MAPSPEALRRQAQEKYSKILEIAGSARVDNVIREFTFHFNAVYIECDVHLALSFFVNNDLLCPCLIMADTEFNKDRGFLPGEPVLKFGINPDSPKVNATAQFYLRDWRENTGVDCFLLSHNLAFRHDTSALAGNEMAELWEMRPPMKWSIPELPLTEDNQSRPILRTTDGTEPNDPREEIILRLHDLIDELELVRDNLEDGDDFDKVYDDLEAQSGTVDNILTLIQENT